MSSNHYIFFSTKGYALVNFGFIKETLPIYSCNLTYIKKYRLLLGVMFCKQSIFFSPKGHTLAGFEFKTDT